jgi:hypothetical protein
VKATSEAPKLDRNLRRRHFPRDGDVSAGNPLLLGTMLFFGMMTVRRPHSLQAD